MVIAASAVAVAVAWIPPAVGGGAMVTPGFV
jgi:hypothetical protein